MRHLVFNLCIKLKYFFLLTVAVFFKHGNEISENGFFFGYDLFIWYLVVLNATGGLLVAVVIKYADNILKGFACSLAIIITCFVSVLLFGFQLSLQFIVGATFVILSIFMYGYQPPKPAKKDSELTQAWLYLLKCISHITSWISNTPFQSSNILQEWRLEFSEMTLNESYNLKTVCF